MTRLSPLLLPNAERAPRRRERVFARAQGQLASAQNADGATKILLNGEVGFDGITETAIRQQLAAAPGDVELTINSSGGNAFDGIGIFNAVVEHPGVVRVHISGLAASAASIIAIGGDTI